MEPTAFTRICRTIAVVAGALIALVGLLVHPETVLAWCLVAALLVGPGVALARHLADDDTAPGRAGHAVGDGVAAALVTMAVSAFLAGMGATLGAGATVLAAVGAGVVAWHHRTTWPQRLRAAVTGGPPGELAGLRHLGACGTDRADGTSVVLPPRLEHVSTAGLCSAWQRSYRLVTTLPPGRHRQVVVMLREQLLDELERRDPDGFDRWLRTEPHASSDPSRHLSA